MVNSYGKIYIWCISAWHISHSRLSCLCCITQQEARAVSPVTVSQSSALQSQWEVGSNLVSVCYFQEKMCAYRTWRVYTTLQAVLGEFIHFPERSITVPGDATCHTSPWRLGLSCVNIPAHLGIKAHIAV